MIPRTSDVYISSPGMSSLSEPGRYARCRQSSLSWHSHLQGWPFQHHCQGGFSFYLCMIRLPQSCEVNLFVCLLLKVTPSGREHLLHLGRSHKVKPTAKRWHSLILRALLSALQEDRDGGNYSYPGGGDTANPSREEGLGDTHTHCWHLLFRHIFTKRAVFSMSGSQSLVSDNEWCSAPFSVPAFSFAASSVGGSNHYMPFTSWGELNHAANVVSWQLSLETAQATAPSARQAYSLNKINKEQRCK